MLVKLASSSWQRLFPPRSRRSNLSIAPIRLGRRPVPGMALLNPFKWCSGLKFLGYFMLLLVFAIIGVSYYAVIILTWGPQLLSGGLRSFLAFFILIVFHILLIMLTWSYLMVAFKDPGSVPENWRWVNEVENLEAGSSSTLPENESSQVLAATGSQTDRVDREGRQIRFCFQCQNGKPPRCHHCSVCQRCVLKMDHHCVWVVNCVGACNYKFFLLFLLYTFLETTMDTLVLLPSFIKFFDDAKNHSTSPGSLAVLFLAFVLNLAFALSLLCFIVMHASLLSSNTTSIEVYEKKRSVRWKYDLGRKRNFEQVFGSNKLLWFVPLVSREDLEKVPALQGLVFPTHSDAES